MKTCKRLSEICLALFISTLLLLLLYSPPSATALSAATSLATGLPTNTAQNLDPLDIKSATTYHSPDGVLDIKLPAGWTVENYGPRDYVFSYMARVMAQKISTIKFDISFGDLTTLSNSLNPGIDVINVHSAYDFIEAIRSYALTKSQLGNISEITRSRIGPLDAHSFVANGAMFELGFYTRNEFRAVMLDNGMFIVAVISTPMAFEDRVKPLIDDMLDTLVLRPAKLLTPTPRVNTVTTPTRTVAPSPTATLSKNYFGNMDPLNFGSAVTYTTPDGVFMLKLPAGWIPQNVERGSHNFTFWARPDSLVGLGIILGTPDELSPRFGIPVGLMGAPKHFDLELQNWLMKQPNLTIATMSSAKLAQYTAIQFETTGTFGYWPDNTHAEFRIAKLETGEYIVVVGIAPEPLWPRTKPLLEAMINSLTIRVNELPTRTPTPMPTQS